MTGKKGKNRRIKKHHHEQMEITQNGNLFSVIPRIQMFYFGSLSFSDHALKLSL